MKIRYLGHSSFLFTESTGTRIITDPYGNIGFRMPAVSADAVTVSHSHYDHNNVKSVGGSPAVFDREGSYTVGGVPVTAVLSCHDDAGGSLRGKNLIFKFHMDGLDICHLGDLGEDCTEARIASILPADVLLIPVGGVYTIDGAHAAEYVKRIKPAVVIPMHYKQRGLTVGIAGPEAFLGAFAAEDIVECGTDEIELSRGNIPEVGTKIIKMERSK